MVSDVEIVYIPKVYKVKRPGEMFSATYNSFLEAMKVLLEEGYFKKRLSVNGRTGYGVKSQKVWHVDSGIAIDFFRTDAFNLFTAKTGGKDSNVQISARAKRMGYKWASEKGGFTKRDTGELVIWVDSEEEIFKFVGLPYLPPTKGHSFFYKEQVDRRVIHEPPSDELNGLPILGRLHRSDRLHSAAG